VIGGLDSGAHEVDTAIGPALAFGYIASR